MLNSKVALGSSMVDGHDRGCRGGSSGSALLFLHGERPGIPAQRCRAIPFAAVQVLSLQSPITVADSRPQTAIRLEDVVVYDDAAVPAVIHAGRCPRASERQNSDF